MDAEMRRTMRQISRRWQLYLFLVPAILYFLIFCYTPMYGVQIAFRNYTARGGIVGSPWAGLEHFQMFFGMRQFRVLLENTLTLSLMSLLLGFPLPVLLALGLNEVKNQRYKKIVQNITYAPHFISTVVLVGMVIAFVAPTSGIVNIFARALGGESIDYMSKENMFQWLYVLSGIWQNMGWGSILYLSALSGVDPQLHEAAQIDGANRLQRIWHINLPGILPTIVITLILNAGSVMNIGFEKVYLMQTALNLSKSEIISTYVYKMGIQRAQYSFSAAVGLFNNAVNLMLLFAVNAIAKQLTQTSLW